MPKSKSRKKAKMSFMKGSKRPSKTLGIVNLIVLGVVALGLSFWGLSQMGQ